MVLCKLDSYLIDIMFLGNSLLKDSLPKVKKKRGYEDIKMLNLIREFERERMKES